MKMPAIAALAALFLAGPVHADEPAPGGAASTSERAPKAAQPKPADAEKRSAAVAPKTAKKPGEATKKEAPCEPVKPCPID